MPRLPSGRYFCIQDHPLRDLLRSLSMNGLGLPELLGISQVSDLKPHLRLMWLMPIGADSRPFTDMHPLYQSIPDGLTLIDSGHTFADLPEELDETDRAALEDFWESLPCKQFVRSCLDDVTNAQKRITDSDQPEDRVLVKWWYQNPLDCPEFNAELEKFIAYMTEIYLDSKKQSGSPPP
jgi:hypothetical protein